MDSITIPTAGYVSPPAIVADSKSPPRTPPVELTGILAAGQFLVVALSDGRFNWQVECRPADVQSFAKFPAVAVMQYAIWIRYASQEESRPARRTDDWSYAVTTAFDHGKASV